MRLQASRLSTYPDEYGSVRRKDISYKVVSPTDRFTVGQTLGPHSLLRSLIPFATALFYTYMECYISCIGLVGTVGFSVAEDI